MKITWTLAIIGILLVPHFKSILPEESPVLVFCSCLYHAIAFLILTCDQMSQSSRVSISVLASFLVLNGLSNLLYVTSYYYLAVCLQTIILLSSMPLAYLQSQQDSQEISSRLFVLICAIITTYSTLTVSYELIFISILIPLLYSSASEINQINPISFIGLAGMSTLILRDVTFTQVSSVRPFLKNRPVPISS